MESRIYKNPSTYDIKNKGCGSEEIEVLCDIFESLMMQQTGKMLRKAVYNLKDFESAEQLEIDAFTLTLERHDHSDQDEWKGVFEANNRTLEVWGMVEET